MKGIVTSKWRLAWIAGLGVLVTVAAVFVRAEWGLSQAERSAAASDWVSVRRQLQWYLRLHPNHERAHLLMARAYAGGRRVSPQDARLAVDHLERIGADSELAAAAQLDAGRLDLVVLMRPQHAETHFRQALKRDDRLFQAQFLLWKTMELTGRSRRAEHVFWRVYQLSPPATRMVRLREWYLGQFFPYSANAPLDESFGFLRPGESPSEWTERRRFDRYLETEPGQALAATAGAQWYQRRGHRAEARKILDELAAESPTAYESPFFVATHVAVLLELGDYEAAQAAFARWPPAVRDFDYWRARAILLDEADANYQQAVEAYQQALAIWPGPIDWRTRGRLANCLARAGLREQAQQMRDRAAETRALLEGPIHDRARAALRSLDQASSLAAVVTFYRRLGRDREADCWAELLADMPDNPSPGGPAGPAPALSGEVPAR